MRLNQATPDNSYWRVSALVNFFKNNTPICWNFYFCLCCWQTSSLFNNFFLLSWVIIPPVAQDDYYGLVKRHHIGLITLNWGFESLARNYQSPYKLTNTKKDRWFYLFWIGELIVFYEIERRLINEIHLFIL